MEQALREMLYQEGASLVGFADVKPLSEEQNKGFPVAVVIAVALNPEIVAQIPSGPHEDYSYEYDSVNKKLDYLGQLTEGWIKERGHKAFAITRDKASYEKDTFETGLPHKTSARLAGLGWIGKNALLITNEFGGAQRLTVVLTDAPLPVAGEVLETKCGGCNICRTVCPGEAIKGRQWHENISRDELVNPKKCQEMLDTRGQHLKARSITCGICMAECPYTKRYVSKTVK